MGCKPQIEVDDGAGGYPRHTVEVINRMGEPGGEQLNVRIVECDARPEVVGRTYRMPAEGHDASAAPHIKDELARMGLTTTSVATVAAPKAPLMPGARLAEVCGKVGGRAVVLFRAGRPLQLRRVGFELAAQLGQEFTFQLANIETGEIFASARIAGHWWVADNDHMAVGELLESLVGEKGGKYEIVDVVPAAAP